MIEAAAAGQSLGQAMAAVPAEIRGVLQRALLSERVDAEGESHRTRKSVPACVVRLRKQLERSIRQALEQTALWQNRGTIPSDKFAALKAAFMEKHRDFCWSNLVFGCDRGSDCKGKHGWPPKFAELCKSCGVAAPKQG